MFFFKLFSQLPMFLLSFLIIIKSVPFCNLEVCSDAVVKGAIHNCQKKKKNRNVLKILDFKSEIAI